MGTRLSMAGYRATIELAGQRLSGRAHRLQKTCDFALQPAAVLRQRSRRGMNLRRRSTGLTGAALDFADIRRDLGGAVGGVLDVARYFLGRGALLFDGGSDGRRYLRHPRDGV